MQYYYGSILGIAGIPLITIYEIDWGGCLAQIFISMKAEINAIIIIVNNLELT